MADFKGMGYAVKGFDGEERRIIVGHLPGRKRVCLYEEARGVLYVMAYFRNEEEAYRALSLLHALVRGRRQ